MLTCFKSSLKPSKTTLSTCYFWAIKVNLFLPLNPFFQFLELSFFCVFVGKWEVFIAFFGYGIGEVFWDFSKWEVLVQAPLAALHMPKTRIFLFKRQGVRL